jgi:antitoxin (DNA-binding transcriptional repressor) of toxin-antitoxin stability system
MKKANIADLKNRLSEYLRFVRAGHSVLVYDRDRAIARIDPVRDSHEADPESWITELERSGTVRPPSTALPASWLRRRPSAHGDLVATLLADRAGDR